MDHTALIWTLAITLAVLAMLLVVDFILIWKSKHSTECEQMRRAKSSRPTGAMNESACKRDVKDAVPYGFVQTAFAHGRAESSAPTGVNEAVAGIDLCGRVRPSFEVKLPPDGKVLHILTPTKAISDRFGRIGMLLERQEQHRLSLDGMEQLYLFASILISNNKEYCAFTPADLKERLTADDIGVMLQAYLAWLTDVIKELN